MAFRGKSGVGVAAPVSRAGQARVLRIIGGSWRGRKLRFPASHGLRPTPDRVRETLFNWLGTRAQDSRCLDLFAGSGALGLEALSRGAAHATFVEREVTAARELKARLLEWGAADARVEHTEALAFLGHKLRELDEADVIEGPSTRLLVHVGSLVADGISPRRACDVALAQALTDDPDVRAAVTQVVTAV